MTADSVDTHQVMTKFIAFLRAINVGGHTVKMDDLRRHFVSLGFANVETFIASGNVLFETNSKDIRGLETKIEAKLRGELGYDVATFLRTDAELEAVAAYNPFLQRRLDSAAAFIVAFLKESPEDASKKKVLALKTAIDEFHIQGRELYWLCQKKQSESTFSNAVLERTTGMPSTLRGMETVRRIAAKYQ